MGGGAPPAVPCRRLCADGGMRGLGGNLLLTGGQQLLSCYP